MVPANRFLQSRAQGCSICSGWLPESCGPHSSLPPPWRNKKDLRTLGGTPDRDPCSLWGLIWGLPRDMTI